MPLPNLPGWIIDFPAVSEIFALQDAVVNQKMVALCLAGELYFSQCEKKSFVGHGDANNCFCALPDCCCKLCGDIANIASNFPEVINNKKFNPVDHSQKIIGATAIYKNFGIVSAKKGVFVTAIDIVNVAGITALNVQQFVAAI